MKRFIPILIVLALVGAAAYGAMTYSASRLIDPTYISMRNSGNPTLDPEYLFANEVEGYLEGATGFPFIKMTSTDTEPGTTEGLIYYDTSEHMMKVRTNAAWTALGAGTFTGGNITSDVVMANGVDILSSTTTAETTGIQGYADAGARKDAFRVTNGATVGVVVGASDVSFALASTGLDISTAGAISNATTVTGTGLFTGGGWSGTGNFSQGDGTGTFAVSSTGIDISSTGAVSNVTTLSLSDDITMANGKGLKSSTTTAETVGVYGYDVDGAAYVGALVVTNGNAPATVLGNANGTSAITSSDWAISTTGAMTGIGAITTDGTLTYNAAAMTVYANEATTWTHATNGAADDWTLALTGANDSSIIVTSAGTGTDAVSLAATAGGITMASTAVASAWTHTSTGAADDLTISVAGNTDSSLILTSAGSGTDALTVSTTANAGDIVISSNDKIDIDSVGTFALNTAGDTLLIQVDSDGAADDLTLKVDGDDDASIILDSDGTGADAVKIGATNAAGGIDVDAGTNGIDILATGGAVAIGTTKNAASAIALTANGGTNETIVVTNTQGTGAGAVTLTSTAGGITLAAAAGGVTMTSNVYVKKGGDIASPAGGELDLTNGVYFDITGTNNITSIAAADSIAGRLIVLQFDAVLTFTDGNNLKLAGNLVTSADDTIMLICDGTNWHEVARSAN